MQLEVLCDAQATETNTFIADLKLVHKELKKTIEDAQCYYQILADK